MFLLFSESSGGGLSKIALFLLVVIISAHGSILPRENAPGIYLAHNCEQLYGCTQNRTPVIMLHGITSSKETWNSIYQRIIILTGRQVCTYDARNHGASEWDDTFNFDVLVQDLEDFMTSMKMEKAVLVGHSMGGITVMKFALKHPDKVEKLFVEDIGVKVNDAIIAYIGYLMRQLSTAIGLIPANASEDRAKRIIDGYAALITENVRGEDLIKAYSLWRRDGVWQWGSNIPAFSKAFDAAGGKFDALVGKMEGQYDKEAVFIYGTASDYKVGEQKEDISNLFPKAEFIAVEGAGHSIHNEFPVFMTKLVTFLD